MRTFKLYFYGLLVLLFVIFIIQNYYTLTYNVAFRFNLGFVSLVSIPLPLFLVPPLFFFLGLFLATMVGWGERRRLSREIKQLKSTQQEPRKEPKQEPKPAPKQELPKPEPRQEYKQEPKPVSEPKKKPEDGTIISFVPPINRAGSPEGNKPPQRS
jgi:uncharacterized integral membrane protein